METTLQRIARKTGRKLSFCKCKACKSQCHTPCLGTPEDIERIIDAGYGEKIMFTDWRAGMVLGLINEPVIMFQAQHDKETGFCSFFKDGLCTLHDKGLKPTEGKLSHHSTRIDNFNPKKSISWAVAKEWISTDNEPIITRIAAKFAKIHYPQLQP